MQALTNEEISEVCGGMDLPPFDPDKICVLSSPRPPQRGDFPPGRAGDLQYTWAMNRYFRDREAQRLQNCG